MDILLHPGEYFGFQTKTSKFCPQAFTFPLPEFHILSGLVAEIPFSTSTAISIMGHVLPDSYSPGQTLESFVLLKLIKVIHGVGKLFEGKKVAEKSRLSLLLLSFTIAAI